MRSLPTVTLGLALLSGALLACNATDVSRPLSGPTKPSFADLAGGCPGDYHLAGATGHESLDRNGDGYVCERVIYFESSKKAFYIDNSAGARGTCPAEYSTPVSQHDNPIWVDENQNGVICRNAKGNEFTDDNH